MASQRKIEVAIVGDASSLQSAFGKAQNSASTFGPTLTKGLGLAFAGLGVAIGDSIRVASSFEQQLANLNAVANPTAKQFTALREAALDFGAKTTFSARQVADAETELAKAGISTSQILGGALKGSLSLAAAGNLDLGDAANIAANAMNLFGLKGTDVTHIADAFATAANSTTADVSDFGMALTQGGTAAKAAGLTFDQTTVILEALAKAGIKNSDAGTSMKTALVQVLSPTKQAAAAMKEHNLVLTDARGNFVSAAEASQRLRTATEGMTAAQKVAFLSTIAGTDGFRTLLALINAGPATLTKYSTELTKQGTAAETAAKMQDTFRGKLEQLKGALETLEIRIGSAVIPVLADLATHVADFVSRLASSPTVINAVKTTVDILAFALRSIVSVVQSLLGTAAAIVGWFNNNRTAALAMAAALVTLGAGVASVKGFNAAMTAINSSSMIGNLKTIAPILAGMTKGFGEAKAGVSLLGSELVNSIGKGNLIVAGVGAAVTALGIGVGLLVSHFLSAKSAMDLFRDSMQNAAAAAQNLTNKLQTLHGASLNLREATLDLKDRQNELKSVQEQVANGSIKGAAADSALEHAKINVARAEDDLKTATQARNKASQDAVQASNENTSATQKETAAAKARAEEIKNSINPFDHSTQSAKKMAEASSELSGMLDKESKKHDAVTGSLRKSASEAGPYATALQNAANKQDTATSSLETLSGKLKTFSSSTVPAAKASASTVGTSIVQGIVSGINNNAPQAYSAIQSLVSNVNSKAKQVAKIHSPSQLFADEVGAPIVSGVAKGIADNAGRVVTALTNTIKGAMAAARMTPTQIAAALGLIDPTKVASDSAGNLALAQAQLTPGLADDVAALQKIVAESQAALSAASKSGNAQAYIDAASALKSATDSLAALGPLQQMADGSVAPLAASQDYQTPSFTPVGGAFTIYSDPTRQAHADEAAALVQKAGGTLAQITEAYQMAGANPSLLGFQLPGLNTTSGYTQTPIWFDISDTVPAASIPAFGDGGVVTKPTLAMVGEKGPEVITPLSKAGGVTLNVYPSGAAGDDPRALAAHLSWQLRTAAV